MRENVWHDNQHTNAAKNDTEVSRETGNPPAYWGGVFAITLCVFALIASEFMPVSLLTPIAVDLLVTEGLAGQGIAISGAFAVLTSLSIAWLAGTMNRKTLLLGLRVLMAISGAVVALAPNYLMYMVGRALIGVVVGGFWSMSAAMAMRLVPSHQVPRALAIFNGGNALAMVVAVPLGSYLGSIIGWRGAFFMGQFALCTYVRPFLETVTHVDVSTLSLILFLIGVAGFIGTMTINMFLKRGLYRTLTIIPILMAVIALALIPFGGGVAAAAVLLGLWGLMATAAPVGWWTWIAQALPKNAEAGGGLMVAVIQLAIALGSTIGGLLFDASGYQSAFVASAVVLLLAALLTFLASCSQAAQAA